MFYNMVPPAGKEPTTGVITLCVYFLLLGKYPSIKIHYGERFRVKITTLDQFLFSVLKYSIIITHHRMFIKNKNKKGLLF